MVQKTKHEKAKQDEVVENDSKTGRSEEVVEAATCCLTDIDALLDEVEAEKEAEPLPDWHWDAEYDPMGSRPVLPSFSTVNDYSDSVNGDVWDMHAQAEDTYNDRLEEWHSYRGLSMTRVYRVNSCVC